VNALTGRLKGLRVLVIDDLVDGFEYDLRQYFDVIISENFQILSKLDVDIFVDTRDIPYNNYVYDCKCHEKHTDTLFCMKTSALLMLSRSKRKLDSYILAYDDVARAPAPHTFKQKGLQIALSSFDPGVHLALIGGAEEIYTTFESSHGKYLDSSKLVDFINETGKYGIPINFKHQNRKNLIKKWA
jgi:hypothetical protein